MYYCPLCDKCYSYMDNRHITSMTHIRNLRHYKEAIKQYNEVLKNNPHNIKLNNDIVKLTNIYNDELFKFNKTGVKVKGLNF